MKKWHQLPFLMLLTLLWSSNLFGQATASGTIQGTVTDNSGAVVVGAEVTAVHKATGTARTTLTGDSGAFRFDLLPVGNYNITATKSGFSKSITSMELMVGQTATINAQLKPGGSNEVVEVTAESVLVDQTKTSVSQNACHKRASPRQHRTRKYAERGSAEGTSASSAPGASYGLIDIALTKGG